MEHKREFFPDGTPIDDWFYQTDIPALAQLGKQYRLDEYGVPDDGEVHTAQIQRVIDLCAETGGVVVIPRVCGSPARCTSSRVQTCISRRADCSWAATMWLTMT